MLAFVVSIPLPRIPFTTQEAYAAGVTRHVLEGPRVRRLYAGVYVAADMPLSDAVRIQAATRVLPPNTLTTAVTALRLYGVEVGPTTPLQFCSTHPARFAAPDWPWPGSQSCLPTAARW